MNRRTGVKARSLLSHLSCLGAVAVPAASCRPASGEACATQATKAGHTFDGKHIIEHLRPDSVALEAYRRMETLPFGRVFTPHVMLTRHERDKGWSAPVIQPFGPLHVHPAAPGLHYGLSCFEGMKAYMGVDGRGRLFRPEMNMDRFRRSCLRLCLADFDPAELLACIKRLLRIDSDWLPSRPGCSLYIRPIAFDSSTTIGVSQPTSTTIAVLLSPVGPYFPSGLKPVQLFIDGVHVRAWPGGAGDVKVAGNYAPTVLPQVQAQSVQRAQQVLYTLPRGPGHSPLDARIAECGTMNIFFLLDGGHGDLELVTPPLDGTILPGVTRDSVIQIAEGMRKVRVSERHISVGELQAAARAGQLLEAFGTGTACVVQPVSGFKRLDDDGTAVELKCARAEYGSDSMAVAIKRTLEDMQVGKIKTPWSVPFL